MQSALHLGVITTLLLFLCSHISLTAQSDTTLLLTPTDTVPLAAIDTTAVDSLKERGLFRRFFARPDGLPQPKTALILSLAVPGAGQVYNGKWWKVPFVYGAIGALGYSINFNSRNYTLLRTAFKRKQRDLPHFFSGTRLDNAAFLKAERDRYDKARQFSYAGLVVVWLINGIEAFTNAHLLNFDVSDDLSWRVQPVSAKEGDLFPQTGMGLVVYFGRSQLF